MDGSGKRRKKKKRGDEWAAAGAPSPSPSSASFDLHFFPALLAAARTTRQSSSSCFPAAAALAARLLRRVLSHSPQTLSPLPASLVALLPLLLSSSCSSVAALSCEVLGAAALRSIEAGETLASDSGIASGLARTLGSRSQRVVEAACNSILDLSASSVGRERLAGSPVLPRTLSPITGYKGEETGNLVEMLLYLKLPTTNYIVESVYGFAHSRSTERPESLIEANKIMCLIIDTVVLLVNSCKIDNLQNLQQELARNVLSLLYKIWKKTQPLRPSTDRNKGKNKLQSKEYDISKTIFRLSIGLASPAWPEPDVIMKSIFGQTVSDFETFVLAYWEKLPNLYRWKQGTQMDSPVFVALHSAFNLGTTPDPVIESLIQGLVSCPAIASDELDINSFLHEVHDSLGDSVKYRQDIRVMRTRDLNDQTSRGCVTEEHFFDDGTVFTDEDAFIEKCKHAFKNGYSIALRGMEFRSEKVAAIASALADLFGQPSVGANIYFSPARSQGLARHYDDHCVLVWQLLGSKKWTVWPNPKPLLPRLYEPFDPLDGTLDEGSGRVEVLREGDMMYIPRGYVHEARTDVGGSEANAYADCSLHLTLAIEVEPPFEWEGFAHIALHCWAEKQQLRDSQSVEFRGKAGAYLSAIVLHVAIRLLSDSDPVFRKACMVAAKAATHPSSSSCTATAAHLEALRSSQRSTFDEILRKIDQDCSIKEALERIASAVRERDDEAFQWMSWLRHLPQRGTAAGYSIDFCNILGALEALVEAFDSDPGQALDGLTAFKSGFCQRAAYEDACEAFGTLLEMYRVARTQYMRGMLALHGAGAHVR